MSNELKREDRYFVIKLSDLDKLSPLDRDTVRSNMLHIAAVLSSWKVPERECLVIESDWPEYEPTWSAIEARTRAADQGDDDFWLQVKDNQERAAFHEDNNNE